MYLWNNTYMYIHARDISCMCAAVECSSREGASVGTRREVRGHWHKEWGGVLLTEGGWRCWYSCYSLWLLLETCLMIVVFQRI